MANNDVPATLAITDGHAQPQQGATGDVAATPQSPWPAAPVRSRLGPEDWRATQEIAAALGETAHGPLGKVGRVVGRLGAARARAFLTRAQEIEAGGGVMLPDGSRRRTPGGVFFHLVRTDATLTPADRADIFPPKSARTGRIITADATPPTPPMTAAPAPAWTDDDYRALTQQPQNEIGRATTVKITVIGRPGAAVEQGQAVALALVSEKVPALAKGLPEPPAGTRYTVFVARKPWTKVAEALAADPEDAAIIEGYAALDPRVDGIAVYATGVTTKHTQAAKRATIH
jgi:hypothetical protein